MKISRFLFYSVLLTFLLVAASLVYLVPRVSAAEIRTRDTTISEDEYVDDDLFLFGDEIKVEGTVTGDLVASGGSVIVSGSVGGNVYASGGEVIISGNVGKSLFVAGGRLKVSGVVERSVYMAGGQILLSSEAYVMEDVITGGGQIDIDGWVGDDVWAGGGNMDIRATIDDDLYVSGGVVRADEGNVGGEYKVNITSEGTDWTWEGRQVGQAVQRSAAVRIFTNTLWFLGMLILGTVFIKFAPVKTNDIVKKISSNTGEFMWSLVVGILLTSALPIAVIILGITIVGAPLAIFLIGLGLFVIMFGSLWADMAVGSKVVRWLGFERNDLYLPLLSGRILRVLIGAIPCVGALYSLVLGWAVIGAVVRMKFERVKGADAGAVEKEVKSTTSSTRSKNRKSNSRKRKK